MLNEDGLSSGSKLEALPGKDPDKIRSKHPARLIIDEACFIESGGEAFDVAISSKVPKVKVVSSAAPSWFRRLTRPALAEELTKNQSRCRSGSTSGQAI